MADKEETFYAVYQYGYAIHGVGKTKEEAIENAKEWVDNQDTLEEDLKDRPNDGEMTMIKVSEAVYNEVEEYGGDVAIQEDEDGVYRLPRESDIGGIPEDVQRLMDAMDKSGMNGFKQLEKDGKVVEVRNAEEFEQFIRSVMPKIDEEVERERAKPKEAENTVYETFNLRINRKDAVEAYIHRKMMSKKNLGNDTILIDYRLFKFKKTDTLTVKPQWVTHGSLYGSSKKLHEYLICELFDWMQIEKFTDINYDGLSPDKREEAMNFDRQIINSFALDEVPYRIYMDSIPYHITYKIIWE